MRTVSCRYAFFLLMLTTVTHSKSIGRTSTTPPSTDSEPLVFADSSELTLDLSTTTRRVTTGVINAHHGLQKDGASGSSYSLVFTNSDESSTLNILKPTKNQNLVGSGLTARFPVKPDSVDKNPNVSDNSETFSTFLPPTVQTNSHLSTVEDNLIIIAMSDNSQAKNDTNFGNVIFFNCEQNYKPDNTSVESTTKADDDKFIHDFPELDCSDENTCRVDGECRPCF